MKLILFSLFLGPGLIFHAHAGEMTNDVSSIAGIYSSAHTIKIDGAKIETSGFVEIDRAGRVSAYERQGEGPNSAGSGCYVLASGTATNAGLQGRILTPGVSPMGAPVYQTLAGDSDTFGILVEPNANRGMRWFFHWGKSGSTATIDGSRNVVNAAHQTNYSISGPALASPTPDTLQGMLCAFPVSTPTFPQSDAVRNASEKEIEGYWELLPLPDQLEPKLLPANPWPAQCQWFSYGHDGQMKSIDKLRGPCEAHSKAGLDEVFDLIPAVISWKYDLSPVYHKGALIIGRSDVKGYGEIWEPQIVVKPFTNSGANFQAGDLLLYLADFQSHKIGWIRHLRKVN
jgi:hypothetical protein